MATVIFYEKPGCGGNARQKALLKRSGHELVVRNLLSESWSADVLRTYFGARPVAEWFNQSAPRVKAGEINPDTLSADAALAAMLADPLLIRRPLLEAGGRREVGFETELISAWIGLVETSVPVTEACQNAAHEASRCQSHANDDPRTASEDDASSAETATQ